jgi:hypothetical protein
MGKHEKDEFGPGFRVPILLPEEWGESCLEGGENGE